MITSTKSVKCLFAMLVSVLQGCLDLSTIVEYHIGFRPHLQAVDVT